MGKIGPIPQLIDSGKGYVGKLRIKAFAWTLGFGLAAAAVILWTPIGWVPAVGVAVAAAVVTMSKMASRLDRPVCYACGADLAQVADGPQGIACPSCGALHQGRRRMATGTFDPRAIAQADLGAEQPAADPDRAAGATSTTNPASGQHRA
jgi:predicted RNA-binding Zn-ribbon protein involved in translation (DUF1610 family)